MSDLVERLRKMGGIGYEAAAEIERLQTQCAALEHYGNAMRDVTIEECRTAARTVFPNDTKRSQAVDDAIRALAKEPQK